MNEEENKIMNEMTLEYLMNKDQYKKYINEKHPEKEILSKKEKKFYRRRICDLTKQLLIDKIVENTTRDIKTTFDLFAKSCIEYFKILDKSDIIQNDYNHISEKTYNDYNEPLLKNSDDSLIMRSVKMNEPNSLEKIVKIKKTKIKKQEFIPYQKEINLKDPVLKIKGIRKKNNINNIYDNENKKEHKNEKNKEINENEKNK
jgi:hypothetical protein